MIQRIQSLYLLLATICVEIILFFPISTIFAKDGNLYTFEHNGLYSNNALIQQSIPLTILTVIIGLLIFAGLVLYKKRNLQMRICIFSSLLLFGLQLGMAFYFWMFQQQLEGVIAYKMTFIMPVIAIVLLVMAFRSIQKDENLVRSIDRIR